MQPFPVSKKILIISLFLSLLIISYSLIKSFSDNSTKIIFCNVGQGDAAYIRINNRFDLLIDAGPDRKILDCLGKYMPFYDRTIEMAFLSHPNNDHYGGYFFINKRYKINQFITVNSPIVSKTYTKLVQEITSKKIPISFKYAGDKIRVEESELLFFWPPKNYLSINDNDFSQVLLFKENSFKVLFTGDASPLVLVRLIHNSLPNINILKIPHHGSKNGLTETFLKFINPQVAVISVGKNSYGHPSPSVPDILNKYSVKIRRTDREGDVVMRLNYQ